MNLYISTSDKSIHCIEAFQYTFNKYWSNSQKVYILGYQQPKFKLENNFQFISLGQDNGPRIANDLINFFTELNEEYFIYTVDDLPLISLVDKNILNSSIEMIYSTPIIGRFGLTGDNKDRSHSIVHSERDFDIIKNDQNVDYKISTVWSIWRRDYFLRYLKEGMNLWEFEVHGGAQAKNDGVEVFGTNKKFAVQACHLYKRGKVKSNWSESVWDKTIMIKTEDKNFIQKCL